MCLENSGGFYVDLDDYDLVLACREKIEPAFNTLYGRYLHFVYGVLHRLAPDMTEKHDDIVQEVFLRVWKCIDTLKNPRALKAWLRQLTTNAFYDELRRRPKVMFISIDEPLRSVDGNDDDACREIEDDKAQPDETFELNETMVQINAAVEELPAQFKNVILLREFYGLTYEEIALRTKSELGTVKSRIARGKSKMQRQLEKLNCA